MSDKLLYIVGGPNGAGKTTLIRRVLRSTHVEYLSADLIAAELSPDNLALAQISAGREFIRRLDKCLGGGQSVLIESTLSGKSLRRAIEQARILDYRIEVKFLFIDSAQLSLARVRQRVRKGGHDVPETDVLRRFSRTFANFWNIYRKLADLWLLTYNDAEGPQDVALGTRLGSVVLDQALFRQFMRIAESGNAKDD